MRKRGERERQRERERERKTWKEMRIEEGKSNKIRKINLIQ